MPRENASRNTRHIHVSGSTRSTHSVAIAPPRRPYDFQKYAPYSHTFVEGVFHADLDYVRKDFKRLLDFIANRVNTSTTEEDLNNLLFHLKQRVDYWNEAQDHFDDEDEEIENDPDATPDYDAELYMVRRHLRRHLGELEERIPRIEQWVQWKIDQRLAATATVACEPERQRGSDGRGGRADTMSFPRRDRHADTSSFSSFFPS